MRKFFRKSEVANFFKIYNERIILARFVFLHKKPVLFSTIQIQQYPSTAYAIVHSMSGIFPGKFLIFKKKFNFSYFQS